MIIEIKGAINRTLKANFSGHKLYGEEVKQGLVRPCFFVDILPIDVADINPEWQERSIIVDIQYMSLEDTKQKNLETSEKLIDTFKVLQVQDKSIMLQNKRFEIIDGILHFLFDIDIKIKIIDTSSDDYDLMGEIHLKQEG